MLYRKRESEATRREMLCPSCHPCGVDSRLRADKPATGCSSQETLSKSMRTEHPRESKQVQDPGQESKEEMVNILWQLPDRKKMDYMSPVAGFGRAGKKGVSYLVDKGHHHKDQRSSEDNTGHPHKGEGPSVPTKTTQ